jgi:ketosteroid isomerase-like protein
VEPSSLSGDRVATLQDNYDAWNRRNLEAVFETLDPDVDFYPSPRLPDLEGHYHGHAGARELFAAFTDSFERYRWEPIRFVENDDQLGVLGRFHAIGRGSGVEVDGEFAHLWSFKGEAVIRWDGDTEKNLAVMTGWD